MSESSTSPNALEFQLGVEDSRLEHLPEGGIRWVYDPGPRVRLVRVDGDRFRAEVDGEPRPIRRTRLIFDQSEVGRSQKYAPMVEEGDAVDLSVMMKGLEFGTSEKTVSRGVELTSCDNWGHFRHWNFYRTTITLGEDLGEQDGSYY